MGSQLLVNATTFMVLPFAVRYLAGVVGLDAAEAGTVVGVLLLSSRLLAVPAGPLTEHLGYRASMALGLLIRGAGFALFALGRDWGSLAAAAGVVGVGGALYEPALTGLLARRPAEDRVRVFIVRNQLLNVGVVVGPAAAAAVSHLGSRTPFFLASTLLGAMGTAIWLMPGPTRAVPKERPRAQAHYAKAIRSQPFVCLCPILILWWVLFTQLVVSIPFAARVLGGSERWVGVAFLVNGATGIVALGWVQRLCRGIAPPRLLVWGLAIATSGLSLVPLVASRWWLLGCIVVYTLGESLVLPNIDLLVASWTDDETASTFFGLALAAWAIGGTAGVYLGTWLMLGSRTTLPWVTYGVVGLAATLAMHAYRRSVRWRRSCSLTGLSIPTPPA